MDTDGLRPDDPGEYNRRTTDYGNGRMEIAVYHCPRSRYTGSGRTPSCREAETSDEAQEERTRRQVYAIRRRIRGYALSNSFRWFVTLTFNPEQVDSSDYDTAKGTLLKWCRRMRDRYGQFGYLMTGSPVFGFTASTNRAWTSPSSPWKWTAPDLCSSGIIR